jgi:ABC-type multidrug transport system fused ATPase/permease subunit
MTISLRRYWALLAIYLRPQWRKALLLALFVFGTIGLQIANPQIIRFFIDTAVGSSSMEPLIYAGLAYFGAALILQVTTVAATYVGEDVGWTATNQLRADLALHCLRLDMSFHNDRTPGQMIERVDGDVANLAIFFSQFVVNVLGSVLLLIGILIALLFEDWRLSLALTVYAIIVLAVLIGMRQIAVPHWKAAREASAELFGFLEEQLAGTEDVRASGAAPASLRRLYRYARERLDKERRAGLANTLMVMTWIGLFTIGQVIAFGGSYLLFRDGILTIGAVYLIVAYTEAIYRPLEQITEQIQNMQKAAASLDRIQELYDTPVQIRDGDALLPGGPLGVRFADVSFSYDAAHAAPQGAADPPEGSGPRTTVEQIDFTLAPGEVLGLLGRTGSGKTTLTRLLFRLYEPTSGAIYLDGAESAVALRETQLDDLRRRVGIVTQDVQIFRASVRDNLTFFDPEIDDERILAALAELGLIDWLATLPNGLDTELAAGAAGLSAGEAQLLAFTRVFLRDPGLVILDEASSRLDPATEQRIEAAIDRLLANRTGIIIAHRLATIHRADRILILDRGSIREQGAYADLVEDPTSRFAQLLRTGEVAQLLAG